jgi:hypothetical protein
MPRAPRSATPPPARKLSPFAIAVFVVMLVTAVFLGIREITSRKPQQAASTQQQPPTDDVATIISHVSKHILVKSDEQPTVATVQDADFLRTQSPQFFKEAQNGDKLLIWSDKAVLYSSARDLLLAVEPVHAQAATTSATTTVAGPTAPTSTRK